MDAFQQPRPLSILDETTLQLGVQLDHFSKRIAGLLAALDKLFVSWKILMNRFRILKIGNANLEYEEISSGLRGTANLEDQGGPPSA